MSSASRKKKNKKPAYRTVVGIQCPECGDRIWSRYGHDYRPCKCGYCFVDGGRDYLRYGFGGPGTSGKVPKRVRIRVTPEEYALGGEPARFPY